MSLLPYFLERELRPAARAPRRLLDQHFGVDLCPDDLLSIVQAPLMSRDYYRPWRQLEAAARDVGSTIATDKDKFQLNLDVQQFSPEEITVKTVDGYVVVEGKHEEKKDEHGFISRKFVRRYALPEDCTPESVESRLSSDGVLTVVAPRKRTAIEGERAVKVQRTGPVRKQEEKEKQNGEKTAQKMDAN